MKSLVISAMLLVGLNSCTKTPEQIAQQKIKEWIEANTNDPGSYEPVDFAKFSPYTVYDSIIDLIDGHQIVIDLDSTEIKQLEELKYLDDLKSKYKAEIDEEKAAIEALKKTLKEEQKKELIKYFMYHKFRVKNTSGGLVLKSCLFELDINLKVIKHTDISSSDF